MTFIQNLQAPLAVGLVILLGFILGKRGLSSRQVIKALTASLNFIFYPCLIFASILSFSQTALSAKALKTVFLTLMILGLGRLMGRLWIARYGPKEPAIEQTNRFLLTMPNYIFLPLPLAIFLYGEPVTPYLIIGALAADLFMWAVAIPTLAQGRIVGRKLINPPLLAAGFAVVCTKTNYVATDIVASLALWTQKIGAGAIPVAMFILGHYLAGSSFKLKADASAAYVTFTRLVFVPLLAFFPIVLIAEEGLQQDALLLVSTMPAALASLVIGSAYGADIFTARRQIMSTHFFACLTIPLWLMLLHPLLRKLMATI